MDHSRASSIYLTLSGDGAEPALDQVSRPRKAFMTICALLLVLSAPLLWTNVAMASGDSPASAVLAKDEDYDKSGPSHDDPKDDDDDDKDDTTTGVTTTGDKTRGENTRKDDTTGVTGDKRDELTGHETKGEDTDRGGIDTGVSTHGETDGKDDTGKTERR